MTQERPEWLGPVLRDAVEDILWIMERLTESPVDRDREGREVVHLPAMPKTAVVHAQGLAFVKRHKVGALLGVTRERVALIGKTVLPDGTLVWSGPVFMKASSISLGLTGGFFNMAICQAISNDRGMASVLRPHRNLGFNAAFLVDMNGSRLRRLRTSSRGAQSQVTVDKAGAMMAKYYLLEAGMVDLSCRVGSFGLDDRLNAAIYGSDFDPQAVLQCKVQPPPEFQLVYDRLNEYVREVRVAHPRTSVAGDRSTAGGLALSRHNSMQHALAHHSSSTDDRGGGGGAAAQARRSSESAGAGSGGEGGHPRQQHQQQQSHPQQQQRYERRAGSG